MRDIILASGSPRRQELLSLMNVPFRVEVSDYDERLDDTRGVATVAEELGLGKAGVVADKHPEAFVIGSDTIVSFEERQLGKQPNRAAARELLQRMSGKSIVVTSSVALVCRAIGLEEVRHESAHIVFGVFSDAAIDAYLDSDDWQDKAGAVAVQSKLWPGVDHMEGSYATILGFPTATLQVLLGVQDVSAEVVEPLAPWPLRTATISA